MTLLKGPATLLLQHPGAAKSVRQNQCLLLYFFSKSHTPRCTLQAQDFAAYYSQFQTLNIEVLGVSRDPQNTLKQFQSALRLPYSLASDINCELAKYFNVLTSKTIGDSRISHVRRSTFLLNPKLEVLHQWHNVEVKGHVKQVVAHLKHHQSISA